MKIRKVMTRKVDIIYTDSTIQQAAQKMKELNIGELPVVDGDQAVGMLTYRDITTRIAAKGLDPRESKVSDAMTMGVVVCKEEDNVDTAAEMMESYHVRRLLVMDNNKNLSGVITLGDLATSMNQTRVGEILKKV
jgi:CBS domain-containing protein